MALSLSDVINVDFFNVHRLWVIMMIYSICGRIWI